MIDLHCHVLPGVDDGALDLADSVAMAAGSARDGVTAICATPHIRHDHDVRIAELPERRAALQAALRDAGVEVRVLGGGEVSETIAGRLTDDELRAVTLGGGGRWILLEPRAGPLSPTLTACVAQLARRGFRCLIAHPERHLAGDLFARLADAIAAGALVQATAAHVEGGPAAAGMRELARRGLIHVVASDAHSSHGGRPVRLSGAIARLREVDALAAHVEWIARAAPAAIVAGDDVDPPYARRVVGQRSRRGPAAARPRRARRCRGHGAGSSPRRRRRRRAARRPTGARRRASRPSRRPSCRRSPRGSRARSAAARASARRRRRATAPARRRASRARAGRPRPRGARPPRAAAVRPRARRRTRRAPSR